MRKFVLFLAIFLPHFLSMGQEKAINTQQKKTITGKVTDIFGVPIPYVTVLIKNTTKGTTSNFEGIYRIQAKENDVLVFSFVGYSTKEKKVGTRTTINIILGEEQKLQEVTVAAVMAPDIENTEYITSCGYKVKRLRGASKYDSRLEVQALDTLKSWQASIAKNSKAIGILIEKERLSPISDTQYQLDISNSLGKIYNLCSNQAFYTQPVLGTGTAFVIGEKSMITAKHVFESDLQNYAIVFGFEFSQQKNDAIQIIPASDIYYPTSIEKDFDNLDVVKFTVNRAFPKTIPVLKWENSKKLSTKNEIYMIGHPSGLPKKIAVNADIVDNTNFQYFYTSLDGFQGNSGSPVFNLCSNKVIGVLVSGQVDYRYNGNCYEVTLCKYPQCKGEKVIRIENIMTD